MRKAVLLPALFLIVVTPIAVWVLSGAGTEMSPLLLYPFASPWWVFFPDGYTLAPDNIWPLETVWRLEHAQLLENVRLLAGCAINLLLLWYVGFLMDRWSARRRRWSAAAVLDSRTKDSKKSEVGSNLFHEDLLSGFIDAERAHRVAAVSDLRRKVALHGERGLSRSDSVDVELDARLRAAELELQEWEALNRDDFTLDAAGEFLEGRTARGKAAMSRR